jgi:hypothetical protein
LGIALSDRYPKATALGACARDEGWPFVHPEKDSAAKATSVSSIKAAIGGIRAMTEQYSFPIDGENR